MKTLLIIMLLLGASSIVYATRNVNKQHRIAESKGVVSANNSTLITLAGGATYTGTKDEVEEYSSVCTTLASDKNSASLGFSLEFSMDGTNWDIKEQASHMADEPQLYCLGVHAKFFRVVYINGSDAQGTFRLQTIYHISKPHEEVKSHRLEMARQQIPGQKNFFFFGFNDAVTTTWVDIQPESGNIQWQESAVTLRCNSSDAADTAAGLGVQSVEVHGLSATGVDQSEVIALSGITGVSSTLTYTRVNKMHSEAVGTYGGSHKGDITCYAHTLTTGDKLAVMKGEEGSVDTSVQYGSGEAGHGFYSTALGKVMYITAIEVIVDVATNKTCDIVLYEREDILDVTGPSYSPRRVLWQERGVTDPIDKRFDSPIKVKPLADVFFRSKCTATSSVEVWADFDYVDANSDNK